VNYPWSVIGGRSNCGCDFGWNVWGSHAGVTTHEAEIRDDFRAMAELGAEVVRWFVWTDGRGGVRWTPDGRVAGVADRTFDDLDAALEIARDAGIRLCLVLFDFSWMIPRVHRDADGGVRGETHPDEIASADGQARIFSGLVDPLVSRYARRGWRADLSGTIHSIDVINEPDWVTRGMAWRPRIFARDRVRRPFDRAELIALVRGVADRVHAQMDALVTVGGAQLAFAGLWDHAAFGLDVIQLHLYPDIRRLERDRALLYGPASALGLSKPVLIGEFPGNGDRRHPRGHRPPPRPPAQYISHARAAGYLGAWPWSFKGVDEFGAVEPASRLQGHEATRPAPR
jgi:hypothetical protein